MNGRLVVCVVEGLEPSLLHEFISEGILGTLKALSSGASGTFESLPVPYETSTLASCLTGVEPGDHGIFSFWRTRGASFFDPGPIVSSEDFCEPYLVDDIETAALVNVFGTHPVKPGSARQIAYPMWRSLRSSRPGSLIHDLHREGIRYGHDVSVLFDPAEKDSFVSKVTHLERERVKSVLWLLERDVDCLVAVLTLIERVSHFFWPTTSQHPDKAVLRRAYVELDRALAKIIDRLAGDDRLLVFSETGFGPTRQFVSCDDALVAAGLLDPEERGSSLRKSVAREAPQGTHGINLARADRFQDGWIAAKDVARFRDDVRSVLEEMRDPQTGHPIWRAVMIGEDLYPGRRSNLAPDLVVLPADEALVPLGDPTISQFVQRKAQKAWHRRETCWFAHGKGAQGGSQILRSMDIAQTIAAHCGVKSPSDTGTSVFGL